MFKRLYGSGPLHLVGHLAAIAAMALAFSKILDPAYSESLNFILWFVGGAIVHDALLLPLYGMLDIGGRLATGESAVPRRVPLVNHIRFPVVISACLFIVYFPHILENGKENYIADSGHAPPDFAARWLIITAGLFVVSAAAYAVRVIRDRSTAPSADPAT